MREEIDFTQELRRAGAGDHREARIERQHVADADVDSAAHRDRQNRRGSKPTGAAIFTRLRQPSQSDQPSSTRNASGVLTASVTGKKYQTPK